VPELSAIPLIFTRPKPLHNLHTENFSIYMQNVLVRLVQLPQNVKSIVLFDYFSKNEPTPPDFEPTFS
jgi:hypothetical protein